MINLRNTLLVTPLLLALVAACGPKKEEQATDTGAATEQTAETPAADAPAEGGMAEDAPAMEDDAAASDEAPASEPAAAPAEEDMTPAGEGDDAPAMEEKKGSSLDTITNGVIASIGGGALASQLASNSDAIKGVVGKALEAAGLDNAAQETVAQFAGTGAGQSFMGKIGTIFSENAGINAAGLSGVMGKYFGKEESAGIASFIGTDTGSKFFNAFPTIKDTATKFISENLGIKIPSLAGLGEGAKGMMDKATSGAAGMGGSLMDAAKDAVKEEAAPAQ
jgi:hypothetical protein